MKKNLIENFYFYFKNKEFFEVESVGIISKHDKSIRFTNSTTSVMKPLLLDKNGINKKYFLIQPSMGTQGLIYRMKNNYIGKYSSYFVSLGCLYPICMINEVFLDCIDFLRKNGFNRCDYEFEVYSKDKDFIKICNLLNISYYINTVDSKPFRHKYGLETIFGRNIQVKNKFNEYELACITIIEEKNNGIAIELSIDSTQIIAANKRLSHSIFSLDVCSSPTNENEYVGKHYKNILTLIDSCNIVAVLMSEGLKPVSRGRSGILKNFLKEAIFHSIELKISKESLILYIFKLREKRIEEILFLKSYLKYILDEHEFYKNINYWLNKIN
ncbi:MAG: hypothetical protein Q8Q23_06395 [bacterium]|nr:hypothetical protein [bacterium]